MRSLLLLLAIAVASGQTVSDPSELLARALAKLREMMPQLSRYACLETVNRSYYRRVTDATDAPVAVAAPPACSQIHPVSGRESLRLEAADRVRLEVSVSQGREIHSWPGATQFDSRGVEEIIRDGPIGTGAYGSYLMGVLDTPGVDFRYAGEKASDGRVLLEYTYRIPLEASHYRFKAGLGWEAVAYQGSLWLDPESLELQRLTVQARDLPPHTAVCEANATIDYHRVRIGGGQVLLPSQGQLHLLRRSARETTNITTFSDCREYHAESELLFGDRPDAESTAARWVVRMPVALPIGLPITLALNAAIDSGAAAAGDPVAATVVKPVRRPGSSEILIPAGATVRGRITRMEHHVFPTSYFLIAMSFNRLERQNVSSPFAARMEPSAELARELGASLLVRESGLNFWDLGTFLFPSARSRHVLPAGFQSKWFTLATPSR